MFPAADNRRLRGNILPHLNTSHGRLRPREIYPPTKQNVSWLAAMPQTSATQRCFTLWSPANKRGPSSLFVIHSRLAALIARSGAICFVLDPTCARNQSACCCFPCSVFVCAVSRPAAAGGKWIGYGTVKREPARLELRGPNLTVLCHVFVCYERPRLE